MDRSTYQRTQRMAAPVLAFSLERDAEDMARKAAAASAGRAAQTLVKDGPVRLTLVGVKDGTTIQAHTAPGPITIQTIKGTLRVTAGPDVSTLPAGSLVAIEPNLTHDVTAQGDSAFLLTLFLSEGGEDTTPAAQIAQE
jgi:quercetin dioxygenase-like cupin family protein